MFRKKHSEENDYEDFFSRFDFINYPDDMEEQLEAANHPNDPNMGNRMLDFAKVIYIERDDFMEEPVKKILQVVARQGSTSALCIFYHL